MANTARLMGNGDVGEPIQLTVTPDATLKAAIAALIAAGTEVTGKLLKWSGAGNYEVSLCADQDAPAMIITSFRENKADSTYDLGVELLQNVVKNLPYRTGATCALAGKVRVEGSDYMYIETDADATVGYVLAVNTTAETADVLFS